jgi:hypothetical protein
MILSCQGITVLDIKTTENALLDPSYYQYNGNTLSYFFGHKERGYHSGAINSNNGPWEIIIYHDQALGSETLNISLEYFCIVESDHYGIFEKNILF